VQIQYQNRIRQCYQWVKLNPAWQAVVFFATKWAKSLKSGNAPVYSLTYRCPFWQRLPCVLHDKNWFGSGLWFPWAASPFTRLLL